MRQRSETWMRLAARGRFRMESIAIIDGVEYTAISAPQINRALIADNLSVGNCISATLKMSVLTDNAIGKSAEVVIKARITDDVEYSEWMEFGTFYIDTRSSNSGLLTIQCYDTMLKASQQYVDDTIADNLLGWPKSMQDCVDEIAERIGVELDPRTVIKTADPYQVPYPNKLTMMQVLGYIGACHGGNWIITPENKLRLVPLLSPPAETFDIIDHDYNQVYTGDGHKLVWKHTDTGETVEHKAGGGLINVPVVVGKIATSRPFTVSRVIITRDSDLGYSHGDDTGYTLMIESNPYACQAICDDLYAELNGLEYEPYSITSACYDPATELGDWVLVGDQVRSVLYSENATLNVDFRVNASAPGKDEVGSEYPYLTSIEQLKKENEQLKKYTETEKDVIYSKIEQTHTDILFQVAGTYATKDSVSSSIKLTEDSIAAEVTRATKAETDEANRATKAEEQLASRITLADNAITAEVTRATKAESDETKRATDAEEQLASRIKLTEDSITAEVQQRTSDVASLNSQLSVQAGQISAKVSQTGGSASTFGWALDSTSWKIYAGSSTVLQVTKDGLEIQGKVTATSGTIGGFTINSNHISYNGQTWGGTKDTGIYIGVNGIQLGKNFKVDSAGNLYAYSGTFTGSVTAGNILYGGDYGTLNGTALSDGTLNGTALAANTISGGKLQYNTVSTSYTSSGINTSLGYADYANGVFSGWNTSNYVKTVTLIATGGTFSSSLTFQGRDVRWTTITDANGINYTVLGRSSG